MSVKINTLAPFWLKIDQMALFRYNEIEIALSFDRTG